MKPVFRSHCVVCGWGSRAKTVIDALRALSDRPVVILHGDADAVLRDVGTYKDVFVVQGDPADPRVLRSIDVAHAFSVLVLADESLVDYSDGRSIEIALSVERIQSAVSTVVELRDIRNKANFSWTKVDDLVTSEHIAVCMLAQGIRHVMGDGTKSHATHDDDSSLVTCYTQLINPHHNATQIFRVNVPFTAIEDCTFDSIIAAGLESGILPVALVGYKKHEILDSASGEKGWTTWKSDVISLPDSGKPIRNYWDEWPAQYQEIGILVLARSRIEAEKLLPRLA